MLKYDELLKNQEITFDKIEECINFLRGYHIDIKQIKDLFVNFILMLYGNREAIKFCEGKNDDEIKHLQFLMN